MSVRYKVTVYDPIQIEITTLTYEKLIEIEKKLELCLRQKLSKIATLLKNPTLKLHCYDGHILVHDRYNILTDFVEIVSSFGMDIKAVSSELRGQCFVISDKIVGILKQIGANPELSVILADLGLTDELVQSNSNLAITDTALVEQLQQLIEQHKFGYGQITSKYGDLIAQASSSLRANKTFNIEGMRQVEQTRDKYGANDILLSSREIGVSSNKDTVEQQLKQFVADVEAELKDNNKHMQNGVTEMLYTRAKQLGYSVEKQKKGDIIQLVMVGLQ